MPTSIDPSMRTDLEVLLGNIKEQFVDLNYVFANYSDPLNNRWALEKSECRRLSTRFQAWFSTYPPSNAGIHYEMEMRRDMMYKKRELLGLMNKLWDVSSNLLRDAERQVRNYRGNTASTDNYPRNMAVPLRDTQDAIHHLQNGDLNNFKEQWAKMLLKIAHWIYECERFDFEIPGNNFSRDRYRVPLDDQENADAAREVYQVLGNIADPSRTLEKLRGIRNERHVPAEPMRDWEGKLLELVPDRPRTSGGNAGGSANGSSNGTNGHANGHRNGTANGH